MFNPKSLPLFFCASRGWGVSAEFEPRALWNGEVEDQTGTWNLQATSNNCRNQNWVKETWMEKNDGTNGSLKHETNRVDKKKKHGQTLKFFIVLQVDAACTHFMDFSDFYVLPSSPLTAWSMSEEALKRAFTLERTPMVERCCPRLPKMSL